jgi:hypothetical protein
MRKLYMTLHPITSIFFSFIFYFNNAQVPGAPALTIRNKAPTCDFFVLYDHKRLNKSNADQAHIYMFV